MSADILLAIDQGTTSTRALLFDADGRLRGAPVQKELRQHFPAPGQVEHDPRELRDATVEVCRRALAEHGLTAADLAGIGITNQRETVVVWDRATGEPLHQAIVWQDRRTATTCARLQAAGAGPLVQERTGLLLDPYFSATKIAWILDHVPGARRRAADGELAAGTVDCWLLWQLTGGAVHATDATNASRTALFDIHRQRWDDELCALFDVPPALLPDVRDGAADFGETTADVLGAPVPLRGVAGDQQSAAIGQACWEPGSSKCTYGTGAFALLNTGTDAPRSRHRLLTTVAFRLEGEVRYAMEGSIFSAGSTMQWLRDGLGLFRDARESEAMAQRADEARGADAGAGVHLVPAFAGLGAPHWDAGARGALLGLTRDTTADDVVRAGLEAVAFQTAELLDAMEADGSPRPAALRVDGGMAANGWLMQRLADQLGVPVERPAVLETTALGAALLAGRALGLCPTTEELAARWTLDRRFEPAVSADERAARRAAWDAAVARVRTTD